MSSSSFSPTIPIGYGIVVPGSTDGLVSSSGVPGRTNGVAIPAGYVGEIIQTIRTAGDVTLTSATASTIVTITLTAGIWNIRGAATFAANVAPTGFTYASLSITTGTTFDTTKAADTWWQANPQSTLTADVIGQINTLVNISSSTSYNLIARAGFSTGTIIVRGSNSPTVVPAILQAVRIA